MLSQRGLFFNKTFSKLGLVLAIACEIQRGSDLREAHREKAERKLRHQAVTKSP